ncbi:Zn-dependent hydrolase [Siculibacillus lacustris]|uniref:Zn-dependent hydrolase n=1 Tax=Siculibacillus lacustris TaxID=1549641 RepID=A0A4Q9VMF2_9HYPH|nr:M20 family metallo-hydrolase [Siculibacillus lacustris]TBW36649.1 Zn-dependent hydrolase [Siculibacillus lacustris]
MIPNLKIDSERLWDMLMSTAKFGGTAKGGVRRLTLTDEDKQVRDWFVAETQALGCTVTVDEVGNLFARRPGKNPALPPIALGSHLDTQPTGGKFDGILGVLGALEALKTLHASGYETNAPIEVVSWTNEEGSRFAPAMLASGVFAGVFTRAYADERVDRAGLTFGAELERIGYRGEQIAGDHPLSAYFELHIEQGPILEDEGLTIGVLTGVQGMRWYEVTVTGQDAHTGATPMRLRKNALVGTARMIEAIDGIALAHGPDAVGTVGLVEVKPNSRNVVPGEVFFTVDFRHPEESVLEAMEADYRAALAEILPPLKLDWEEKMIWNSPAVKFAPHLIDCVDHATDKNGYSKRRMVSGAGHDAVYLARVTPTTMIFVPCAGGLSHNEAESTSQAECAAGAQVLLDAVLEFDASLGA